MRDHLLNDLYILIRSGAPLRLSWVVAHGDAFSSAWDRGDNPALMLSIAAHVVPRRQLVIATCAVARTALRFVPKGALQPLHAIEAAEAWARGEATEAEVRRAAVAAAAVAAGSVAGNAADAAYYSAAVISVDADHAGVYAANVANDVAYADRKSYRRSDTISAQIIRKHIHITVADLVRAGKNGWEP